MSVFVKLGEIIFTELSEPTRKKTPGCQQNLSFAIPGCERFTRLQLR
jgi:hypothetical protein